jgi:hypothetical protein
MRKKKDRREAVFIDTMCAPINYQAALNSSRAKRRALRLAIGGKAEASEAERWIPTRSATPSTALVPQRKGGFPIPNAGLLLGFPGDKDGSARRNIEPLQ